MSGIGIRPLLTATSDAVLRRGIVQFIPPLRGDLGGVCLSSFILRLRIQKPWGSHLFAFLSSPLVGEDEGEGEPEHLLLAQLKTPNLDLDKGFPPSSWPSPIKGEGIVVIRHPEASYSEAVRISSTKSVIARNEVTWQSLDSSLLFFSSPSHPQYLRAWGSHLLIVLKGRIMGLDKNVISTPSKTFQINRIIKLGGKEWIFKKLSLTCSF